VFFFGSGKKQLDALFDGHAFNHSAGCQVDGCGNVPGMGKSSVEQGKRSKTHYGKKSEKVREMWLFFKYCPTQ